MKPKKTVSLDSLADPTITTGGEPVEIEVRGVGATGYLWRVVADEEKVEVTEHRSVPDGSTFGASGKESFVLRPLVQGESEVRLELRAPWEDSAAETHTLKLLNEEDLSTGSNDE